jgi:hypothetical protein
MAVLPPINPFRPGAGHKPLYLAGRNVEQETFKRFLGQSPVTQNVIITGLRGIGKTVLLDDLKPLAQSAQWLWAGNDLSESASLTEERIARRIITDLSILLGPLLPQSETKGVAGFRKDHTETSVRQLHFDDLWKIYEQAPGLVEDKLKNVLLAVGQAIKNAPISGIVFAYDEAQNLSDHKSNNEYPLSMLLDVFSYFQRSNLGFNFLLVLCGLPTLLPKLNEARTYTERMFHIMKLDKLTESAAREAILMPIKISKSQLTFPDGVVDNIINMSGRYPYFIQFICKEVFDSWIVKVVKGRKPMVAQEEILDKLDEDFFSYRWIRATDRQQEFLHVIASMANSEGEFSVSDVVGASRKILKKGFSASHATQILQALSEKGLIYKSRRASYMLAVPLMSRFIKRQDWDPSTRQT